MALSAAASAPRERRRTPLSVQVLALIIVSLVLAQIAAFTVVLAIPPERIVYRMDEIASALRGGPLQTRFGRPLVRRVVAAPPAKAGMGWFPSPLLRRDLARDLGVKDDDVRLQVFAPPPLVGLGGGGGGRFDGRGRWPGGGDRGFDRGSGPASRQPPGQVFGQDPAYLSPPPRQQAGPDAPPGAGFGPPDGQPPEAGPGSGPPGSLGASRDSWRWRGPPLHASFVASLRGADGRWTTVSPAPEPFPNSWQRRVIVWFLASIAVIGPLGWLFARRLAAPLRAFAAAADRLGADPRTPLMDLKGPAEIGAAAQAFNRMQARLQRYVEDRTAMVGAISHDLRTPLARIRFKVEAAPPELRRSVLNDVAQMEEMITSVLVFIRDASEPGPRERVDLRSLVECEVDEAALVGGDVELLDGAPLVVVADASGVQRVVANLIDNALKYGERARLRIFRDEAEAVVEVADEGPGLPDGELERVFLPFYRAEAARSLDKGGIGLGLAVSRSIARAHGGDVRLRNAGEGLLAQVRLPLAEGA